MERDRTTSIAVRMPDWILACIDAHVARMQAGQRLLRLNRSDALRDLVVRALEALDPAGVQAAELKARSGEQVELPLPPSPPPPPVKSSDAPPGEKVCGKGHRYPASRAECPECARLRKQAARARQRQV